MTMELKDDLPAMSPQLAKEVMQKYQAICKQMLEPIDYSTIQGKKHKNKSAWRKLARAFGISDRIIAKEEILGKDSEGKPFSGWRIHVEAFSGSGRTMVGVGVCTSRERQFAHPDHDIYATAHTRAKNRAISDLIGCGEVSAEEIEAPKTIDQVWPPKGEKK